MTVAAAAADWTTCHAALTAPVSLTLAICLSRLLFLNIPTEQLMTAEEYVAIDSPADLPMHG